MAESPNTDRAKARLREVGREMEVVSWVREWPFTTLWVAAVAGGVAARVPCHILLTFLDVLSQVVVPEEPDAEDGKG